MSENIDNILDAAEQREASDVFLQEDEIPRIKVFPPEMVKAAPLDGRSLIPQTR